MTLFGLATTRIVLFLRTLKDCSVKKPVIWASDTALGLRLCRHFFWLLCRKACHSILRPDFELPRSSRVSVLGWSCGNCFEGWHSSCHPSSSLSPEVNLQNFGPVKPCTTQVPPHFSDRLVSSQVIYNTVHFVAFYRWNNSRCQKPQNQKNSLQCYEVQHTQIRHMCSHTQPAEHWNTNTKYPQCGLWLARILSGLSWALLGYSNEWTIQLLLLSLRH